MYQNLQINQQDFESLKNKINRKDPFKQSFNHDVSSVSELEFSKHETPGRFEAYENMKDASAGSSNKPMKALDKHIYGAVPFEYRPGQVKKANQEIDILRQFKDES